MYISENIVVASIIANLIWCALVSYANYYVRTLAKAQQSELLTNLSSYYMARVNLREALVASHFSCVFHLQNNKMVECKPKYTIVF